MSSITRYGCTMCGRCASLQSYVADSETLVVLFTQSVKMADADDFWSSDTRLAPFSTDSKGLDMDLNVIYDEDCDCEETISSYYDDAGQTENITSEGDYPAEKRASAFKFKRRDMYF